MLIRPSLAALAVSWVASAAIACGFHNYKPRETLVDRLSRSSALVLVRPDPANPFRFATMETLTGTETDPELPHLVDSVTRRRLGLDEDTYVLFSKDSQTETWDRVAFVDDKMSEVLAFVMPRLSEWSDPASTGRYEFFATLIEDEDMVIQRLALREIDQADYPTLRALDLSPDPRWLIARMHTASELDLLPIRVLLLGFADQEIAAERLQTGLARVVPIANSLVGAYATAFIEHEGQDAVIEIAQTYLADPNLPDQSKELLVEALAIHADASPDTALVMEIQTAIANLLTDNPARYSAMVARQFGARQDWSHAAPLTEALRQMAIRDPGDMIAVADYVAKAKRAAQRSVN